MKFRLAVALLMLCLGANAQGTAPLTDIQVSYRLDPWLVSGNYVGGLWVSPPVFGPVLQGGNTFVLEVRAAGLDASGQVVAISPQWVPTNPGMVTVTPSQGSPVTLTVQHPGRSSVTVSAQGFSKDLVIQATPALQNTALLVQIDQTGAPGPPSPPPSLTASPNLLTFAHQIGGAAPPAQTVNVGSSGAPLPFTVSADMPWLSASPASGNAPASLSVSADPAGLAAGTHSGTITITSPGLANTTRTVAVVLNVMAAPRPSLLVSPTILSFSSQAGGPAPISQSASIASSGAAISFTAAVSAGANWLSAALASGAGASGSTPATLIVSVDAAGLAAGTHTGTVTVSSADAANSLQIIEVILTVTPPPPGAALSVNPRALTFTFAQKNREHAPHPQRIAVGSRGSVLGFTISATSEFGHWLSVQASSLTTPATLFVNVDPRGLAPGTYRGAVTVSASSAANSPRVVPVTLVIKAPGDKGDDERQDREEGGEHGDA